MHFNGTNDGCFFFNLNVFYAFLIAFTVNFKFFFFRKYAIMFVNFDLL